MRYVVTVAGREVVVEVDGTVVRVDGEAVAATLEGEAASGSVVLTLDGSRHRLRVTPGEARGAIFLCRSHVPASIGKDCDANLRTHRLGFHSPL